jgi:hypothetical protein
MLPSNKVLIYEVVGTLFIIFLGSAFHFTYEFSGRLAIVGARAGDISTLARVRVLAVALLPWHDSSIQ